jgi:hypothetical protein
MQNNLTSKARDKDRIYKNLGQWWCEAKEARFCFLKLKLKLKLLYNEK